MRFDPNGRVYYVDHNTRTTTWQRPCLNLINDLEQFQQWRSNRQMNQMPDRFLFPQQTMATDDPLGPLPLGWGNLVFGCFITGPPTHSVGWPVLFCCLLSAIICHRLSVSFVTLHGGPAGGFTLAGQEMTSCRLQSNYSSAVTLHGGPVVLRPVRTTPCLL